MVFKTTHIFHTGLEIWNLEPGVVSDQLPDNLFCRLADIKIPYLPISLPISEDDTFRQA